MRLGGRYGRTRANRECRCAGYGVQDAGWGGVVFLVGAVWVFWWGWVWCEAFGWGGVGFLVGVA